MNFFHILSKELKSYFGSPVAYIVITAFLVLTGYFFYSNVIYFNLMNMGNVSIIVGVVKPFFYNMGLVITLTTPLLTMRLFAEEKKLKTIELLMTYPIRDIELLLGKYFSGLTIFTFMLMLTLLHPFLISFIWEIPLGPLLTGYLGIFLLGCSLFSLGILVSSLTENQIVTAIVTFSISLIFWVIAWNEGFASPLLGKILNHLSFLDHLDNFTKGTIETKDVIYFLDYTFFCLILTAFSLKSRRWRGLK